MEHSHVRSMGLWLLAAAILTLMLMGCAQGQRGQAAAHRDAEMAWQLGPLLDEHGSHRSLSFDSPLMAEFIAYRDQVTTGPAWYDGRLDRGPRVVSGTRRTTVLRSHTRTRDRLNVSDGDVRDTYSSNTSRQRTIEVVR